jgi:geranyl-CoA carboxylase alpha subunit
MVKAAAGGGGRGMRLVTDMAQLAAAVNSARSESQSAFGSSELLLERALLNPRHVEVQVFADAHGHCIHLGERDCSVQRRHQKIIEETPSPAVDAALRERMGRCAVELAQAAGYVGAGTVEFLVDQGEFYLMEMNTRLQVEHPVTEMVTGLDLVEWQIRVARGEPLPLAQAAVKFTGHAIEVRLCAEDEAFTPHAGQVKVFPPLPLGEGRGEGTHATRFDHAIFEGMEVPPHYDSMLGKLIAHAPTRSEAIAQLAGALDRLQLLGLPTNRAFLAACLRHETFAAGQSLIPFLSQQGDAIRAVLQRDEMAVRDTAAQAVIYPDPPSTLACSFTRPARLRHRGEVFDFTAAGDNSAARAAAVRLDGNRWHVQCGATDLFMDDVSFDPPAGTGGSAGANELRAPFNGKVIAVHAVPGAAVRRGDTLLTIESMKLEHSLAASRDGVVRQVSVVPGQQAVTGQVLVALEPL